MKRAIRRPNAIHRELIGGRPNAIAEDVYSFKLFTKDGAKQALRYFVEHSTPESPTR